MTEPVIGGSTPPLPPPPPVGPGGSDWKLPIAIVLAAVILGVTAISVVLLWPDSGSSIAAVLPPTPTGSVPATSTPSSANLETATNTSSPVPALPSTPDAKPAARAEAIEGIHQILNDARIVRTRFEWAVRVSKPGYEDVSGTAVSFLETADGWCRIYWEIHEPQYRSTLDLWPTPYAEVWSELWKSCVLLLDVPQDQLLENEAFFVEFRLNLLVSALDAVPDYSRAQLDRAIVERQ